MATQFSYNHQTIYFSITRPHQQTYQHRNIWNYHDIILRSRRLRFVEIVDLLLVERQGTILVEGYVLLFPFFSAKKKQNKIILPFHDSQIQINSHYFKILNQTMADIFVGGRVGLLQPNTNYDKRIINFR